MAALVCASINASARRGRSALAETYLQRYPEVAANAEPAIDLIFNEFLVRERLGDRPDPDEFLRRFPKYAAVLAAQFLLHRELESGLGTGTVPPSLDDRTIVSGNRAGLPGEAGAAGTGLALVLGGGMSSHLEVQSLLHKLGLVALFSWPISSVTRRSSWQCLRGWLCASSSWPRPAASWLLSGAGCPYHCGNCVDRVAALWQRRSLHVVDELLVSPRGLAGQTGRTRLDWHGLRQPGTELGLGGADYPLRHPDPERLASLCRGGGSHSPLSGCTELCGFCWSLASRRTCGSSSYSEL